MSISAGGRRFAPLTEFTDAIHLVPYLHAKVYVSEKAAVFASMNLMEVSDSMSTDIGYYSEDPNSVKELHDFMAVYLDPIRYESRLATATHLIPFIAEVSAPKLPDYYRRSETSSGRRTYTPTDKFMTGSVFDPREAPNPKLNFSRIERYLRSAEAYADK